MLVFENNNYIVEVGKSNVAEGVDTYLCRNKMTNVVEMEETLLPQIIEYARQLDEATSELMTTENMYPTKSNH